MMDPRLIFRNKCCPHCRCSVDGECIGFLHTIKGKCGLICKSDVKIVTSVTGRGAIYEKGTKVCQW